MKFAKHCINAWMSNRLQIMLIYACESPGTNNAHQNICFNSLSSWLISIEFDNYVLSDVSFFIVEFITVTPWWARLSVKSPESRVFTQPFVQAQIKENIKALRHWRLWGAFTGDPVKSPHKGPVTRKCVHLMTSSCDVVNVTIRKPNNGRINACKTYMCTIMLLWDILSKHVSTVSFRFTLLQIVTNK